MERGSSIFPSSPVPRRALFALAKVIEKIPFEAGQCLFEEGESGTAFWMIRQGTLEMYKSFFGERHRLTLLSRGAILGEANLYDDSPRTSTVQAITDGKAYRISNCHARALLEAHPVLGLGILRAFAARSTLVEQTLLENLVQSNLDLKIQNARLEGRVRKRVQHLEEHNSDLRRLAWTDSLTGCGNRRGLERALKQACQSEPRFAVAIFDVDHFKHYNDTHGHLEGDRALQTLVRLVLRRLRPDDFLARYGGEEFCLLLRDVDGPTATRVCERLRQSISDFGFPFEHQQPLGDFTVSMGLALAPAEGKSPQTLLKLADDRLYEAKHLGRNRLVGGSDASL